MDKIKTEINNNIIRELYNVVALRKETREEGSYTCYLFDSGLDKILKKLGEECAETIIAAKNNAGDAHASDAHAGDAHAGDALAGDALAGDALTGEICDLLYHLIVLMVERGLPLDAVFSELEERARKMHNLKKFKTVDKNT